MERASADYMGMLATVINALGHAERLGKAGRSTTRVQSADPHGQVAEPYIRGGPSGTWRRAGWWMFGAGTGNPFFTTDTAAALRASEMG